MVRRLWRSGALLLVLAMLFWSGNFVLGRAVHELITPIALSFWRWTLALAILLPYAWGHVRKDMPALRAAWKPLLVLAFLGISVFNTLVYLGLRSTAVVNGVLLQSAMPLVILLFSFALFRERVRVLQVVAIGVSLLGVGVIVSQGSLAALLQFSVNPGDAWIFTAVCCYALYSVLLRKRPQVHPLSFLAATFAIGAAILLPFYVWEEIAHDPFQLTRTTGAAIVYVALFPSIISFLCFNRAVELLGANRAGQFVHLMPVFGSALAALFLDERLAAYHFGGAALIAAGILLSTLAKKRPAPAGLEV
jgi:drug/metabolite transporter (DMT)-like permease